MERRHKQGLRYEARWQPLLDAERDARRVSHLAAAMPAICRAEAKDPGETIPPRPVVESFLNHMTDAVVREWSQGRELHLPSGADPAARWLQALFAPNPTVQASAGQMRHFASSLRAWERALTVAGASHYRIALRWEAPAQQSKEGTKKEDVWQLHYLLQARDDASLLVPAAEVWKTNGGVLQAVSRHFDRPKERLLTGLGYAARFFQPIQQSLQKRNPTGTKLTTDEAYTFLRQCAPQLRRAGFGLLVPPWWNKPGTRLGVRLKLNSASRLSGQAADGKGHMALDKLVRFRWRLSLGDTESGC